MSRDLAITSRHVSRSIGIQAGSALDRLDELFFHLRFRPNGLAHEETTVSAKMLDKAIGLSTRYLNDRQQDNGRLSGFLLYPGASTTWISAHIAFVVEDIPQLKPLCRRAANYLAVVGPEDGGWGFNRRVAPDCDSMAQALMVLKRFDLPIRRFLIQNLVDNQMTGGGFPTYPPPPPGKPQNGWQVAHPEVSAIVIEALRRIGGYEDIVQRGQQWVQSRCERGVLHSYWWRGNQYGLWVQARTGLLSADSSEAVKAALRQPTGVPMLPFVLTAAAELSLVEEEIETAVRRLLLEQHADGSWDCQPCLRVTSKQWLRATPDAPGLVVADRRRVFSTAHALAALFQIRKNLVSATAASFE
jgi:hypothetical protein